MVQALELSVVRIYGKQGKIVGAGFLISPEYLLTCAHVVASALGIDSTSLEQPKELIQLDFPIIKAGEKLTASVEVWVPVKPNSSPEDIAVLKLRDPLPVGVQPISLVNDKELYNHEFETLGFPEGRSNGAWAEGVLKRPVAHGWIQIEDTKSTGYRLEEGFSGTAIWDKRLGGVVGMAVAADKKRPEVKAAFLIPTHLLLTVWDQLPKICSIQRRKTELITLLQPYYKTLQGQIKLAYQQCSPEKFIGLSLYLPNSLDDLVTQLDGHKDERFSLLGIFICHLISGFQQKGEFLELSKSLVQWLDQYQDDYQDLLKWLEQKQENKERQQEEGDKRPCLLMRVSKNNGGLMLQAWVIKDMRGYRPNQETECKRLTEKEVNFTLRNFPEILYSYCCEKSPAESGHKVSRIHLYLPYDLVEPKFQYIDLLTMKHYSNPIGAKYEVTLGFSERIRTVDNEASLIWKQKCKKLKRQCNQGVKYIFDPIDESKNNIEKLLMKEDTLSIRFTNAIQDKKSLKSIMAAFYKHGIPLAFWFRQDIQCVNFKQEELDSIYQANCLTKLVTIIKNQRYAAWGEENHIGNHLSLLWDDADLLPPTSLLREL